MIVDTRAAGIALAKRESMILNDANVKITCRQGCLWLTERCGSEDIVLEPGQSHVSRAPGVVIEALRAPGFELRTPSRRRCARAACLGRCGAVRFLIR